MAEVIAGSVMPNGSLIARNKKNVKKNKKQQVRLEWSVHQIYAFHAATQLPHCDYIT